MSRKAQVHSRLLRGVSIMLLLLAGALLAACGDGEDMLSDGEEAPEFTLPAASGGSVSLQDYEGEQPVLLYFHMALG